LCVSQNKKHRSFSYTALSDYFISTRNKCLPCDTNWVLKSTGLDIVFKWCIWNIMKNESRYRSPEIRTGFPPFGSQIRYLIGEIIANVGGFFFQRFIISETVKKVHIWWIVRGSTWHSEVNDLNQASPSKRFFQSCIFFIAYGGRGGRSYKHVIIDCYRGI